MNQVTAYQKNMKLVQSMLTTWDLGIMMEHEKFLYLIHAMDYLLVLATISLIRTELGHEYDYIISLNLLK